MAQKVPNLAIGYMRDEDGGPRKPNTATLPWRGSSAGGGDSTVGDLLGEVYKSVDVFAAQLRPSGPDAV